MRHVLFLVLIFSVTSAFAIDQSQTLTRTQFEDISIQSGGVNINNFSFREDKSFWDRNMSVLKVNFSARNRNDSSKNFAIMLVGFDNANNIIWSMHLEPTMGILSENSTEQISDSVFCTAGTLNRTHRIWYRVIGNF